MDVPRVDPRPNSRRSPLNLGDLGVHLSGAAFREQDPLEHASDGGRDLLQRLGELDLNDRLAGGHSIPFSLQPSADGALGGTHAFLRDQQLSAHSSSLAAAMIASVVGKSAFCSTGLNGMCTSGVLNRRI